MKRFSDEEIELYLAVTECRRRMRRGETTTLAVSAACLGREVLADQVLELARKAHHACARSRHRYKHYQRTPARTISDPGNRMIANGQRLGLTPQTPSEAL